MDVVDQESIDRARDEVVESVGEAGLAGLVNNAGIGIGGPLEFIPLEDLRWMFKINLFGLLAVTQAFLPLLQAAKGRVINVSSTATIAHAPFHGP